MCVGGVYGVSWLEKTKRGLSKCVKQQELGDHHCGSFGGNKCFCEYFLHAFFDYWWSGNIIGLITR
jgi:hypothetical protein